MQQTACQRWNSPQRQQLQLQLLTGIVMDDLSRQGGLLNDSMALGAAVLSNISKQQQQQDILYITDNRVTDSQLTTS